MIYLDYNATTPTLPEVFEAMLPWLKDQWGNSSSIHTPGRIARRAVEESREKVAAFIGALPEQVIFTSGATEANNAALHSAVFRHAGKRHVVTSVVEHSAVLSYCAYLERVHHIEVTYLPVDSDGSLDPIHLCRAIRPETAVVSLMWANNETGGIWPIPDFAGICRDAGTAFHTDAVQAVGKIPVSFAMDGLNYLTLSGHKIGGPKGVGALVVRDPSNFLPFIHGGQQEGGKRGGTENVAQIVGLGAAAAMAMKRGNEVWSSVAKIRDEFENSAVAQVEGTQINGDRSKRLPNTSNLSFPGLDGDSLVTFLDRNGIFASSGSACLQSAISPSHVILAMTQSHEVASESIRFSFGLDSKSTDLARIIGSICEFVTLTI